MLLIIPIHSQVAGSAAVQKTELSARFENFKKMLTSWMYRQFHSRTTTCTNLVVLLTFILIGTTQNSVLVHEEKHAFENATITVGCNVTTNGSVSFTLNNLYQHESGILLHRNGSYYFVNFITKGEYNNFVLRFFEVNGDSWSDICIYTLLIEEPIGPPTELSIETGTNGHSVLKCTPPNNRINAVEVSYISKRTHETILVELHTCSYTFMTYGFPVTFSIVAVSLAGKGETAFLNYTVPSWCHITDTEGSSVNVTLENDTVSVVVSLSVIHANSCFDEVAVQVRDRNGSLYLSETTLPTIQEDEAIIVLPHMPRHTHLGVTLSTKTLNFSTHNVQDVVITYYENSLSVKCVYLEGVTRSCYIVAIQDGVVIYNNTISHLTSLDIPGNFTLKVFDSAEQREPAIVQNVTRPIHVPEQDDSIIYGIVAAVIVVVVIAAILLVMMIAVVLLYKKRKRTPTASQQLQPLSQFSTPHEATSDMIKDEKLPVSQEATELDCGQMVIELQHANTTRRNRPSLPGSSLKRGLHSQEQQPPPPPLSATMIPKESGTPVTDTVVEIEDPEMRGIVDGNKPIDHVDSSKKEECVYN